MTCAREKSEIALEELTEILISEKLVTRQYIDDIYMKKRIFEKIIKQTQNLFLGFILYNLIQFCTFSGLLAHNFVNNHFIFMEFAKNFTKMLLNHKQ